MGHPAQWIACFGPFFFLYGLVVLIMLILVADQEISRRGRKS